MTKGINKNIRFNSEIQTIEKVNPMFSRATIKVLYTGFNRNGSYFSKDSVLKSIDSIYNIPLVGEYIEHTDNFGDHGTSLEIKGNEIKLVQSTKPYGLIPESANIYWENVTEKNGVVNEYLIVDGAYLWTGRYEELNTMLEQPFNQSMEIEVINGNFAVIDGKETFNVDEFLFSALCILGIEKDGEGHVEPAFESASITAYSLDKDDFKKQFNQMVAELKFSLEQGGNKKMEKEKKTESVLSILDTFTEEEFAEAVEMNTAFNANTNPDNAENPDETFSTTDEPKSDTNPDETESTEINSELADETSTEFALTANQLREQLRIQIGKENHVDRWGDTCRSYWYVDHTDTTVIFENYQDGYQLYEATYSVNGDNVEVQTDKAYKVKIEYVPFEGESVSFTANLERFSVLESQSAEVVSEAHAELNENYTALTSDYEVLKDQLTELQDYKRQTEESEIKGKFEGKLSDDEFTQVFAEMKENTLESIEEKLFALIGKKNFSIQSTQTNSNVNKVVIPHQKDNAIKSPYGDFFAD